MPACYEHTSILAFTVSFSVRKCHIPPFCALPYLAVDTNFTLMPI